jgi:hypothetical protein
MDATCPEKYRFSYQTMGFSMCDSVVKKVKIGTFEGEPKRETSLLRYCSLGGIWLRVSLALRCVSYSLKVMCGEGLMQVRCFERVLG